MLILQWLGIMILAGGIIFWTLKGKEKNSCCSGCASCPLQNRCDKGEEA